MILLELVLGTGIGFSLGLLGGGGSILTVPALVYLIGQTPQMAVMVSLVIVGANSLMGALMHRSQGTLDWKVALLFGGAGMLVSYFSANLSKRLPPALLMVIFALLMLVIGVMLFSRDAKTTEIVSTSKPLWLTVSSGAGVGFLTGLLGVGGGFLVVPALVMLVGLPAQIAVGTSLMVIAMNSAAGFLGHIGNNHIDLLMVVIFVSAGLIGTFAGAKISKLISSEKLQKAFAVFVVVLAVFLLFDNLPKLF